MIGMKEEAVNFVADHLIKDPDMPMKELQVLGAEQGINVYPLIMGLAKKQLGMGNPKRAVPRREAIQRPVGRPVGSLGSNAKRLKAVASNRSTSASKGGTDPLSMFSNFIDQMKRLEQENHDLRQRMDQIAALLKR
jgi:hypothetical protein